MRSSSSSTRRWRPGAGEVRRSWRGRRCGSGLAHGSAARSGQRRPHPPRPAGRLNARPRGRRARAHRPQALGGGPRFKGDSRLGQASGRLPPPVLGKLSTSTSPAAREVLGGARLRLCLVTPGQLRQALAHPAPVRRRSRNAHAPVASARASALGRLQRRIGRRPTGTLPPGAGSPAAASSSGAERTDRRVSVAKEPLTRSPPR